MLQFSLALSLGHRRQWQDTRLCTPVPTPFGEAAMLELENLFQLKTPSGEKAQRLLSGFPSWAREESSPKNA